MHTTINKTISSLILIVKLLLFPQHTSLTKIRILTTDTNINSFH